jgi:hypothetical protein
MPIKFDYGRDGQVTCSNPEGLTFYLLGQPTKLAATFVPDSSLTPTSQGHNRVSRAGVR